MMPPSEHSANDPHAHEEAAQAQADGRRCVLVESEIVEDGHHHAGPEDPSHADCPDEFPLLRRLFNQNRFLLTQGTFLLWG